MKEQLRLEFSWMRSDPMGAIAVVCVILAALCFVAWFWAYVGVPALLKAALTLIVIAWFALLESA